MLNNRTNPSSNNQEHPPPLQQHNTHTVVLLDVFADVEQQLVADVGVVVDEAGSAGGVAAAHQPRLQRLALGETQPVAARDIQLCRVLRELFTFI